MEYKNVLHIDDDYDDLEFFTSIVEEFKNKINCISISSAAAALEKLISKEINPDIIFLDLNMPGMDGVTFLKAFNKVSELKIPVIILSTSSHYDSKKAVESLGVNDYLTKPACPKEFFKMLSNYFS